MEFIKTLFKGKKAKTTIEIKDLIQNLSLRNIEIKTEYNFSEEFDKSLDKIFRDNLNKKIKELLTEDFLEQKDFKEFDTFIKILKSLGFYPNARSTWVYKNTSCNILIPDNMRKYVDSFLQEETYFHITFNVDKTEDYFEYNAENYLLEKVIDSIINKS